MELQPIRGTMISIRTWITRTQCQSLLDRQLLIYHIISYWQSKATPDMTWEKIGLTTWQPTYTGSSPQKVAHHYLFVFVIKISIVSDSHFSYFYCLVFFFTEIALSLQDKTHEYIYMGFDLTEVILSTECTQSDITWSTHVTWPTSRPQIFTDILI